MTPDEAALLEKYRAEDGADKQRVLGGASAYNVITVIHPIGPFVRIDGGKPDGLEVPAQFITADIWRRLSAILSHPTAE